MSIEDKVKSNASYFTKKVLEKFDLCGICIQLMWHERRICGKCDTMICENCYERRVFGFYDKEDVAGDVVCLSCVGLMNSGYFEVAADKEDLEELIRKIELNKYR